MANSPSAYRREGREAFENGLTLDDCPYRAPYQSPRAADWSDGWRQAQKDAAAERKRLAELEADPRHQALETFGQHLRDFDENIRSVQDRAAYRALIDLREAVELLGGLLK